MSGADQPETFTGEAARSILASAPPWARAMVPRREPDGRIVLVGELDGCYIWVQPKAWAMMANPGDAAPNYGLQMQGMHKHSGQLETNDRDFGRELLGTTRAGSEVPLPDVSPRSGTPSSPLLFPSLLIALGLVGAALIVRLKRRPS